ncbi:MAG: autotransporter-associated beta strand repeat-containing protein, partial [Candidatus Accumulibacter sp.]|nr:autotransporter-associated beta strand repeat-containing protein [Accumulibacter sp.]
MPASYRHKKLVIALNVAFSGMLLLSPTGLAQTTCGNVGTISGECIEYTDTEGTLTDGNLYPDAQSGNVVIIDYTVGGGKDNPSNVYGANGTNGSYSGNTVHLISGNVTTAIYGGHSSNNDAVAINNKVFITGGSVRDVVIGGYGNGVNATVSGNEVSIKNSEAGDLSINASFRGGRGVGNDTKVINNTVKIENFGDGKLKTGAALGGNVDRGDNTKASDNTVSIVNYDNGTLETGVAIGGLANGNNGGANFTASGNTVSIQNHGKGTITITTYGKPGILSPAAVYGGAAYSGTTSADTANDNTVIIVGSTVDAGVYGGWSGGGNSGSSHTPTTAGNNTVSITDSKINGEVVGGFAQAGESASGASVSDNEVIITGNSVITSNVYGGRTTQNNEDAHAQNNTVTIDGTALISGSVYGGYNSLGVGDYITDNTLNKKSAESRINLATNFEYVNFDYDGKANIGILTLTGDTEISVSGGKTITFDGKEINDGGAGLIAGNNLIKTGTGVLEFTGNNTYTGTTTIKEGLIRFKDVDNFGDGKITLDGGGLQWAADYDGSDISDKLNGVLGKDGGIFDTNGNDLLTLTTALSGYDAGSTLTKTGEGVLALDGNNTYSGGTTINKGLIRFKDINNFGDGKISLNGGGLQWAADYKDNGGRDISSQLNGVLGENGGIFDTNGNDLTLTTALSDDAAGSILTKTGEGALTLTGDNTYSGGTMLDQGTIVAGNDSALGTGRVTMSAGTTLGFKGNYTLKNEFLLGEVQNDIATFDVSAETTSATLEGKISGAGILEKTGAGTLILSNDYNDYSATVISVGTLIGDIPKGGNLTMKDGTIYDGDDAERSIGELSGVSGSVIRNVASLSVESGDFAGDININIHDNGTGGLIKEGGDPFTFSGAYTGPAIEVRGGWLDMSDGSIVGGTPGTLDKLVLYGKTEFTGGDFDVTRLDVHGGTYATVAQGNPTYDSPAIFHTDTGNLDIAGKTLNFHVPFDHILPPPSSGAILYVDGKANIDMSTVVSISVVGSAKEPEKGRQVILIDTKNGLTDTGEPSSGIEGKIISVRYGSIRNVNFVLGLDPTDRQLLATVGQASLGEESKALSEAYLAGMTQITQGLDLAAGRGIAVLHSMAG